MSLVNRAKCMPWSLTSGFLWSRWRGKSCAARKFYVSGNAHEDAYITVTSYECHGLSPVTDGFPTQRVSNARSMFRTWRLMEYISRRSANTRAFLDPGRVTPCTLAALMLLVCINTARAWLRLHFREVKCLTVRWNHSHVKIKHTAVV